MKKNLKTRGVASLPIVLVFGILIVAIGVGITALSFTEGVIAQGDYQSSRALLYAEGGARDALVRISRNKNYICATTDCYALDFATNGCSSGTACARMSVSAGVGSLADPKIVTAKGQVGLNTRILQAQVIFDSTQYGQIATTTWQELTN